MITLRCKPDRPVTSLELRGELPHWSEAIAMQPIEGGWFEARLRLGTGVHEVKLRTPDGAWILDPGWRTVTRGGETNGVLVVGGAGEPVLHAPAAPWLAVCDDGRVIVRASLRRGAGFGLRLRVDEGGGEVVRQMRRVGDDGDHHCFEAEVPGVGRAIEYAFVLADGRVIGGPDGRAFHAELRKLAVERPAWWQDAVVYTVLVDRFRRGGAGGRWLEPVRTDREHRAGGDLDGVAEAVPYLRDLGVTVLHLTPVCAAPSPHRYDATDPRAVDPALGGEAAFDRLVTAAQSTGLRVIVDVAATHVDRDFAPFRDVREKGPASRYWRWFRPHRWPFFDGPDPGYQHYQKGQWKEPLLALDEPEVADFVCETFAHWARRGADGLRVDAAADLPLPLIARLRDAVRAARADAVVFGEVVPACVDRYVPGALDAATDFAMREATVGWLRGAVPAAGVVAAAVSQRRRGAAGAGALGFVGTHDQPRITTLTGDAGRARLGLLAVALGARVPLLYYGDEVGLVAEDDGAATRTFEDSWPDRQPMPWDRAAWDVATLAMMRGALALRRDREVLRVGDEEVSAPAPDVVCIRRRLRDQVIDIVLHRGGTPVTVTLPPGDDARAVLAVGDAAVEPDGRVRLGARSAIVVDRRREPLDVELALRDHNAALAAQAFRDGHVATPAYPQRLYVTVTEACNLRCLHCITDAPERSRSGTARTIAPWVLDALDEAFAHADHVAFTHGGESLAAPGFPEVLRRIQRARAGRRTDVHLISNGTLLDEARVRSLIELGVTSLMVSLDGATARTNDAIRVLGRFDRVVANLAGAVKLRAALGADLRIGVSTVLGRSNLGELAAIGRLCRDLGVDWLKVEETYPATPFARRDAIDPADAAVLTAMAALRETLAGSPIVLVDHLAPPGGCTCTGDDAARAFRAADDFANRFAFRPCRAAWQQAAVDPDGTVHVGDYAGPALGNLLDAPFLDLWNAPAAIAVRERALAASPEIRRRACVGGEPNPEGEPMSRTTGARRSPA